MRALIQPLQNLNFLQGHRDLRLPSYLLSIICCRFVAFESTKKLTRGQAPKLSKQEASERDAKYKQKPNCTCLITQFTFLIPSVTD